MEDLEGLRSDAAKAEEDASATLTSAAATLLSRRDVMLAGVSGAAGTAVASHLPQRGGHVTVTGDERAFHLCLDGEPVWHVDTAWFDGNPRLLLVEAEGSFELHLSGALLTGTQLCCDFRMAARKSRRLWTFDFDLTHLRACGRGDLHEWLAGVKPLVCTATIAPSDGGTHDLAVHLAGDATLILHKDWRLEFHGKDIASVRLKEGLATCSRMTVVVAPAESASLASTEGANAAVLRRAHLLLEGDALAALLPQVAGLQPAFDDARLTAEFSRHASNIRTLRVLASWRSDARGVLLAQAGGAPLPVTRLWIDERFGRVACKDLSAVPFGSHWIDLANISYELRAGPDASVQARQGTEISRAIVNDVYANRFVVPFVGADVAYFEADDAKPEDLIEWKSMIVRLRAIPLGAYRLVVRRSIDGFAGVFRFGGLQLAPRLNGWVLQPVSGSEGVLSFELESQHVQEEAIYSASAPGTSNVGDELICVPVPSLQARVLALVADVAMGHKTEASLVAAVRQVLHVFSKELCEQFRKVRRKGRPAPADVAFLKQFEITGVPLPVPKPFLRYLTQEYGQQLVNSVKRVRNTGPVGDAAVKVIEQMAEHYKDDSDPDFFSKFEPQAVESDPSRLVFDVTFERGSTLPFSMRGLLGWSEAPVEGVQAARARFHERLSERAVPTEVVQNSRLAPLLKRATGNSLLDEGVTSLELPYRLSVTLLKPAWNQPTPSRWRALPAPKHAWGAPNELWHVRAGDPGGALQPMRALASPDFRAGENEFFDPPPPFSGNAPNTWEFRASLDAHDRHNLVGLSGSFGRRALAGSATVQAAPNQNDGEFISQPFHASRLMLTPQGASFDVLGRWDPPAAPTNQAGALTVSKWEHHARLRRDTSVTVEYKGFLLPLGIPAVLIKRTTREFKRAPKGTSYRAVLVQRFSIRVEPGEFDFPAYGQPFQARDWFLRKLKVDPPETPPLLPPENTEVAPPGLGRQAFWPAVPSANPAPGCANHRLFEFTVTGGGTEFRAPLVFVDNQVAHTPQTLKQVLDEYVKQVDLRKQEMEAGGNYSSLKALATLTRGEIEYLPGAGSRNSRHETIDFVLGVALPAQQPTPNDIGPVDLRDLEFNCERERLRKPPFYPRMSQARVSMALLSKLSGNPVQRNRIAYHPKYVQHGFDPEINKGQVFMRLVDEGAPLGFGGDTTRSGGPFAASTQIMAIAREHGPIGGAKPNAKNKLAAAGFTTLAQGDDSVGKFMQGLSDPIEYFGQKMGDAKIAGCVRMVDVVKTALSVSGTQVPKLNQQEVFDDLVELLRPVLQDVSNGPAAVLKALADTLEKSGLPTSALEKLRPSLNAARSALAAAVAGLAVSPTDAAAVGASISHAYSHLKQFLDDARTLADNPVALLPPSVAQSFETARTALGHLQRLRAAIEDLPRFLWGQAMAALAREVDRLEAAIIAQPQFRALQDAVTSLRTTLLALERAAQQAALDRAASILAELLTPLLAVQSWVQVAVSAAGNAALKKLVPLVQDALTAEKQIVEIRRTVNVTLCKLGSGNGAVHELNNRLATAVQDVERREIQAALQCAVQLREGLIAFAGVAEDRAVLAAAEPLHVVRVARSYLEAFDVLLRSGAELHRHLDTLHVQVDFQGPLHAVLKSTGLLEQVQAFEKAVEGIPADAQSQISDVLHTAHEFAQELKNAQEAGFKQLLAELKQTVLEELSVRLNGLVSALLPQAAKLMAHAVEIERCLQAAMETLVTPLDLIREAVAPVAVVDLSGIQDYLSEDFAKRLHDVKAEIGKFTKSWPSKSPVPPPGLVLPAKTPANAMRSASAAAAMSKEVSTLVAYVGDMLGGGNFGGLVNLKAIGEKVLAEIGVPSKLRISYDWRCDIDEFPRGGAAVFRPAAGRGSGRGGSAQLMIASCSEVSLRGKGATGSVTGKLDAFSLHLFGSAPFLILDFHPITFQAGTDQPMKFDVKLENVRFGQALKFVNELAALLNADSGFYVQLLQGRPGIEVGYRFNKDVIQLAAMTLQNVSFSVAVLLPFDNSATRFKVAVGTRHKPILASVGIYGGGFFAALTMRADTMELIEAAFEYGGVTGCEFGGGIAKGTCKIVAGVYLALGVRDEITGYFCASGALTIASIFRVGGELLVSLTKADADMSGLATYTFSFSIGLFDYSYSVSVSYTKGGGGNMNESADGRAPRQQSGTTSDAVKRMTDAWRDLDARAEGRAMAPYKSRAPDTADHVVNFTQTVDTPGKLHAGLSEASAWRAYVGAFADLEEGAR